MITLVIIDNNYYANNKDKVEKNRKNLKYTQIGTMEMMNWRGNIKVSKRQLIDVGIILDSTQTDEDKVYKN